jgi:low affinity Fe/Cu permease
MTEMFRMFSQKISTLMGSPWSFFLATTMVIIWAFSGRYFNYSDTWELIINTATTIITFLMVFIIQNSQNRDMRSLHLKMDELIRATRKARNSMMEVEHMSENEINQLEKEFRELKEKIKRNQV